MYIHTDFYDVNDFMKCEDLLYSAVFSMKKNKK